MDKEYVVSESELNDLRESASVASQNILELEFNDAAGMRLFTLEIEYGE